MTSFEVDGIKVKVDPAIVNDYSFFAYSCDSQDPEKTDIEKAIAVRKMLKLVLGKEHDRVIGELRKKNGGTVTTEQVGNFFAEVITRMNALKK